MTSRDTQAPEKATEREGVADATRSGCSKWGPGFPPTSCNAFEDCAHDGVCHDFDQCQIKGPAEPDDEDDANEVAALAPKSTGTEAGRGVDAVPAGWKLVPEDPTEEMQTAGWIDKEDVSPKEIYWAMLAATPTPPVSPTPDSTGPAEDGWRLVPAKITHAMADDLFRTTWPRPDLAQAQKLWDAALAALNPSAPIAAPVREAIAADVPHYIQSSEDGISLVPRQLLCRIKDVLLPVVPDDPAPAVPAETTS